MNTFTRYQLYLSNSMTETLNGLGLGVTRAYCDRQATVLARLCPFPGEDSVNIDNVDVAQLIYDSCEQLYGTITELGQPHYGYSEVRSFIAAVSRQLMINAYHLDSHIVLVLDLVAEPNYRRPSMQTFWLAAKYKNELYINTLQ